MKTIGLFGCGSWGKNILRDLVILKCQVYVVDPDPQVKLWAYKLGASEVFSNKNDLPVCDGYVVAVPIPQLVKGCADLLQYRKPIFSEKTLGQSLEDFNLLESMNGADYIFLMHKWHYHPGIEAIRVIGQAGRIGQIEELHTKRHTRVNDFHGGDVFWTLAVHDLTIIKHILGYIPEEISAINVIKNEDDLPVSLTATIGNKPVVKMSVNGQHRNKIIGVSIHGRKGSAELYDCYDDHITIRNNGGEDKIAIDTTFPLYLELKEFVEYLQDGPRPQCNLKSAKEITQTILALKKASKEL